MALFLFGIALWFMVSRIKLLEGMKPSFWCAFVVAASLMGEQAVRASPVPVSPKTERLSMATEKGGKPFVCDFHHMAFGLTSKNQMVYVAARGEAKELFYFEAKTGRLVRDLLTGVEQMSLSPDGTFAAAISGGRVVLARSNEFKIYAFRSVGKGRDNFNPHFLQNRNDRLAVAVVGDVPRRRDSSESPEPEQFIQFWNLKKKRLERTVKCPDAWSASDVLLSSGGKYIAVPFFASDGPGEYAHGMMTVIDGATGKISQTLSPQDITIEAPAFFWTATKLVVQNNVFDLRHKKHMPLFVSSAREPRLKCVGSAAGFGRLAFFTTKRGLELWNLSRRVPLHRWLSIKTASRVWLSPDKTVMALESRERLTFWRFDKRWLQSR